MALEDDIQDTLSDLSGILGMGLMYTGGGALFLMAIFGTIAVDVVLLATAQKYNNTFLTALVFMSMFMRDKPDPVAALIASPITSGVAVILAFCLGVPQVGFVILAGWTLAVGLLLVGYGLMQLSEYLKRTPDALDCHSEFSSDSESPDISHYFNENPELSPV